MIVLPAIDLRRGRCVRLRQGDPAAETVYDEDPAAVARHWVSEGAEWLHVVNLDGALDAAESQSSLPLNLQRLAEIHAAVPETPIQFGGGLRSLAAIQMALDLGATRAVLGTVAVHHPELLAAAVRRFGAERVVLGVDAREGRVATHGWQQTSEISAVVLGREARRRGVVRAVYTDIQRDGMLSGVNVEATAALARATELKVIASGGVATLADLERLRRHAPEGIEGVIVGQALYRGAFSLGDALRASSASTSAQESPRAASSTRT